MTYIKEKEQETSTDSLGIIDEYLKTLQVVFEHSKINLNLKKPNTPFIDFIIETERINFAFRITTSRHEVAVSNKTKYWKVRSDISGATKNFRQKRIL